MADIHDTTAPDNSKATRIFPPYLLFFIIVPLLPFLFSITTLSVVIDPEQAQQELTGEQVESISIETESKTQGSDYNYNTKFFKSLFTGSIKYIDYPDKTLIHLSNLLSFLSISSLHAVVCLFLIVFFLYQTHQLPGVLIKRTYLYMAFTFITVIALAAYVAAGANDLILTQLGYKAICVMLSNADLQTYLVMLDKDSGHTGHSCFGKDYNRLYWLANGPTFLGALAIIVTSSFSTVMASEPINSTGELWRQHFLARVKLLQKCFYLLCLVLVTSTITIYQFSSLPIELIASNKDSTSIIEAFRKFINSITLYWGGLFTATLFATFAPAVLLLFRQTCDYQKER